jgi:hypothetical protein
MLEVGAVVFIFYRTRKRTPKGGRVDREMGNIGEMLAPFGFSSWAMPTLQNFLLISTTDRVLSPVQLISQVSTITTLVVAVPSKF